MEKINKNDSKEELIIKQKLEDAFNTWVVKRKKKATSGYHYTINLPEAFQNGSPNRPKQLSCFAYSLKSGTIDLGVSSNEINLWKDSREPVIIIASDADKLVYLLITEHFINSLFSDNPSWTALDSVNIAINKFTQLTKAKHKEIQAFAYSWKKVNHTILKSGTYFEIKESLDEVVRKAIGEIEKLGIGLNLETLKGIEEGINKAIYTVAIVGPTKAGKSTIINSLVSKYVSPIDIRPTTGIPTIIVPGKEEKTEILFKDRRILKGAAEESFLNDYVSIDNNKGNFKEVKMVTVWVRSTQMEKGLSFCDFPGLDDPDPEIEKTVNRALQFVDAIIYVIDASGMEDGFKFPKYYRDDLKSLKDKDRIFLVINKIDKFQDPKVLLEFKKFLNEQLEGLEIKPFLPNDPIYLNAKKSFEARISGNDSENDAMELLESQVWNHLLANNKSGMHNLMNIISDVSVESDRLIRIVQTRMIQGEKKRKLQKKLETTQNELRQIRAFETTKRQGIRTWLTATLNSEKEFLLGYYREHLDGLDNNTPLPGDVEIKNYINEQFEVTAPNLFENLENEITGLHNELNRWVNNRLEAIEISINSYSKTKFRNSEAFNQLLIPIANIFSESYGKSVPTGLVANIFYHLFDTLDRFGTWLSELFTDKATLKVRNINTIMIKLRECYDQVFSKMLVVLESHLNLKCNEILNGVNDRTNVYTTQLQKQLSELNNPLTEPEKNVHNIAIEKLIELDTDSSRIKLQIEDYTPALQSNLPQEFLEIDEKIEIIEKRLRSLINTILTKKHGIDEAKKIIPTHMYPKIEDKIGKYLRDHPNTSKNKYKTLEKSLQFFDFSQYFELISSNQNWDLFTDSFNSKNNLEKHIVQISNLRNAIRHSRDVSDLVVAEGNASIIWFNMALKTIN